jgi:hypothetical protein
MTLGETVRAFLPPTLPPNPLLTFTAGSQTVLEQEPSLSRGVQAGAHPLRVVLFVKRHIQVNGWHRSWLPKSIAG